jgi:prevent-host-death family protein
MKIAVSQAKAKLTDLVRRAEAGEDIVLTRNGKVAARLVKVPLARDPDAIEARIREIQAEVRAKGIPPGPSAARSADFLYDEFGLPA